MDNKKILEEVIKRPHLNIYNQFHIASQFNSDPLFDFTLAMEAQQYKELLPKISYFRINRAIKKEKRITFLIENGILGFVAEVYQEVVVGLDGEDHIVNTNHHHILIMHDESYENLMKRVFKAYDTNLQNDLNKIKEKNKQPLNNITS